MWWFISLILVLGVIVLWLWLSQRRIRVPWYNLFLSLAGLLLLIYAIHNFLDFRVEHETIAAWNSLVVLGLPALSLLMIVVFLTWFQQWRRKKAKPQT